MLISVWVESWQQQCCGDEFRVGSAVSWNVIRETNADWITTLLGPAWGSEICYWETTTTSATARAMSCAASCGRSAW